MRLGRSGKGPAKRSCLPPARSAPPTSTPASCSSATLPSSSAASLPGGDRRSGPSRHAHFNSRSKHALALDLHRRIGPLRGYDQEAVTVAREAAFSMSIPIFWPFSQR